MLVNSSNAVNGQAKVRCLRRSDAPRRRYQSLIGRPANDLPRNSLRTHIAATNSTSLRLPASRLHLHGATTTTSRKAASRAGPVPISTFFNRLAFPQY